MQRFFFVIHQEVNGDIVPQPALPHLFGEAPALQGAVFKESPCGDELESEDSIRRGIKLAFSQQASLLCYSRYCRYAEWAE